MTNHSIDVTYSLRALAAVESNSWWRSWRRRSFLVRVGSSLLLQSFSPVRLVDSRSSRKLKKNNLIFFFFCWKKWRKNPVVHTEKIKIPSLSDHGCHKGFGLAAAAAAAGLSWGGGTRLGSWLAIGPFAQQTGLSPRLKLKNGIIVRQHFEKLIESWQ